VLLASPVFRIGRLEKTVRILMIISGLLILVGIIGVPLANMNIRNIGILGYVGVSVVVFLLLGIIFEGVQQVTEETE
jgi:hypothetical protein